MSRSNPRSATGSRKPGASESLPPLLLDETVRQRARGKKKPQLKRDTPGKPDVIPALQVDVDAVLDKQAAQDMQENGIARRRIEMLREARWLQQQLAESYDP